jgi:anti-sigma factor RsiW
VTIHPAPVTERDLHGWADDTLSEERRAVVAAHLGAHPEDAARVAAWQRQNEALRLLYPAPAAAEGRGAALHRLGRQLARRLSRGAPPRRAPAPLAWGRRALLGGGLLAAGAAGALLVARPPEPEWELLTRSGVEAHQALLQGWRLEPAAQRSAGTGAPDLSAFGYRLAGWRSVWSLAGGAGTEFLYRDGAQGAVTVLVRPPQPGREESFAFVQRADLAAFTWIDGEATFTLVGGAHRADLLKLADAVHAALVHGRRANPPATHPL